MYTYVAILIVVCGVIAAAVQSGGSACYERFVNYAGISLAFTSLNINRNSQLSRGVENESKFLLGRVDVFCSVCSILVVIRVVQYFFYYYYYCYYYYYHYYYYYYYYHHHHHYYHYYCYFY